MFRDPKQQFFSSSSTIVVVGYMLWNAVIEDSKLPKKYVQKWMKNEFNFFGLISD